jgi:hypothetical protein
MSSSALTSQGMTIGLDADGASPFTYVSIAEVKSIDGPGGQTAEIDVTDLSSSAKEFVLGLQDEGDITLDMNYIPSNTQHTLLRTLRGSGVSGYFQIAFTDSPVTTWSFTAKVKGFSISNAVDNVTGLSVTLRVTGSITEA